MDEKKYMNKKELIDKFNKSLDQIQKLYRMGASVGLSLAQLDSHHHVNRAHHEFRIYLMELTKKRFCVFCNKKIKLSKLSHEEKTVFYSSGLCPICDKDDEKKPISSMIRDRIIN